MKPTTVPGWRPANAGVNQRPTTCCAIDASPADRTWAARPAHIWAGGRHAEVQHSASAPIRDGAFAASHMPTMPPSETPQ